MPFFIANTFLILDNPPENYAIVAGILFATLILTTYIARFISGISLRFFERLSANTRPELFRETMSLPLKLFLWLIGFGIAMKVLEYPKILDIKIFNTNLDLIIVYAYKILLTIAFTLIIIRLINFGATVLFNRAKGTPSQADDQIILSIKDILNFIIVGIAILFVLGKIFGVNITALLAGAGIAGVAIALAAKETLENLLATLIIFMEGAFSVGDYIEVQGAAGTVEKVGLRSTRLRTAEKTFLTVPNRKVIDAVLDNQSQRTMRRIRFFIKLEHNSTAAQIQAITTNIKEYILSQVYVKGDINVSFFEFTDTGLQILVEYYVTHTGWNDFLRYKESINFKIMQIIEKEQVKFSMVR